MTADTGYRRKRGDKDMRQSTRESVLQSCTTVQTISPYTAAQIAQGWRELARFSRQLNPHNTELHTIYDKLAEMFEARVVEGNDIDLLLVTAEDETWTAREGYDLETRGTFDAEGRVRS